MNAPMNYQEKAVMERISIKSNLIDFHDTLKNENNLRKGGHLRILSTGDVLCSWWCSFKW